MFERLSEGAASRARDLAEGTAARIAEIYDAVPGVRAEREGGSVIVEGRGLARRMIEDARLRWGWR